jgi:NAD(P)H-quinone oxidoreductase subunit 4
MAQVLAHGLIVALLFDCVGLIQRKTGTTVIAELSGLMNPIRGLPFTMGLMLLALMAAAGIPGLAGFPAELLVFEGSWTVFPRGHPDLPGGLGLHRGLRGAAVQPGGLRPAR